MTLTWKIKLVAASNKPYLRDTCVLVHHSRNLRLQASRWMAAVEIPRKKKWLD